MKNIVGNLENLSQNLGNFANHLEFAFMKIPWDNLEIFAKK